MSQGHTAHKTSEISVLKGRLQSNYKFVLKVEVLYADIPAKNDFSQKFMFWPPEAKRYKY